MTILLCAKSPVLMFQAPTGRCHVLTVYPMLRPAPSVLVFVSGVPGIYPEQFGTVRLPLSWVPHDTPSTSKKSGTRLDKIFSSQSSQRLRMFAWSQHGGLSLLSPHVHLELLRVGHVKYDGGENVALARLTRLPRVSCMTTFM